MENLPLISVIVPVYKVEAYLDKCISSIAGQTYRNLEIILVDDGSPDNCGAICDAWAVKDSRIKVIHRENAGGGAARNTALDTARGELIAFVDSDDYLSTAMFEKLYQYMVSGADLVECSYVPVRDDEAIFVPQARIVQVYTPAEAMAEHIHDRYFRQLIWNKLYRRQILEGVRFPEEKGIDDEFFTYQVIGNARKLVRTDAVLYAYRQQECSVMHTLSTRQRLQAVKAKIQRHAYVCRQMPQLEFMSGRSLWFTCMYQGQRALLDPDSVERERVLHFLESVLKENPISHTDAILKDKLWLTLAGKAFELTCRLRNLLRIGV